MLEHGFPATTTLKKTTRPGPLGQPRTLHRRGCVRVASRPDRLEAHSRPEHPDPGTALRSTARTSL